MRLFIAVCAVVLSLAAPSFAQDKESAFDRILRTGVLRCGYATWPPTLMKDPNTGKFSGVYYDYMEALGRRLDLKIEWTHELTLDTYLDDLATGKFDVECSGGWPNARRAKKAEYTMPLYYTPVYLYAREGDKRFDGQYERINDPKVRFVTMPGEVSEDYKKEFFPSVTEMSVPPTSMLSDLMLQLSTGKGDVVFYDHMSAREFMKSNPGKVRRIDGPPVKVIPNNLSVAKGEFKLVSMLNEATQELVFDGVIEKIMRKYDVTADIAFRPALPFDIPEDPPVE